MTRLRNRLGPDGFLYVIADELLSGRHVRRLVEDGNAVALVESGA